MSNDKTVAARVLLLENPDLANAFIADAVGLATSTIAGLRRKMEDEGELRPALLRLGRDGKQSWRLVPKVAVVVRPPEVLAGVESLRALAVPGLPPAQNPFVRLIAEAQASLSKGTERNYITALGHISRDVFRVEPDQAPWQNLNNVAAIKAVRGCLVGGDLAGSTARGYFRVLMNLVEMSFSLGHIEPGEHQRMKLVKPPRGSAPTRKARLVAPDEWLHLARGFDLGSESAYMRLSLLCLTFPIGARPSDAVSVTRSGLQLLDKGLLLLGRPKTENEGYVLVDAYPNVREIFRRWLAVVPADREELWYDLRGKRGEVLWDRPVGPDVLGPAGRVFRWLQGERLPRWSCRCGRVSFETYMTNAGLPEHLIRLCGGWGLGAGANRMYMRATLEQARGHLSRVPEFMQFDRELGLLIGGEAPEVRPDLPRCACGCGASIEHLRDDAKWLNDGHRKQARRRAVRNSV